MIERLQASSKARSCPSGILTFLFTDIQGSTPLWEKDPAGMGEALAVHNAALHKAIETHGGQVFKIVGDEFQVVFKDSLQAVKAAVAAQRALSVARWGRVGPLTVRMGLHIGPAVWEGHDYAVSHTFNRVARIMSTGHGGQILLSVEVVDQLDGRLPDDISLRDMGRHRLKGLTLREHLFQLIIADLPRDFPTLKTEDANTHEHLPYPRPAFETELPTEFYLLDDAAQIENQIKLYENEKQYPAAINLARMLLRDDPLNEEAYRRLMHLQSLDGNIAGALRTFHACSSRLQNELGVKPSPTIQAVYEQLLNIQAPSTPLAPSRLPLVAREQAWQILQGEWNQCHYAQPKGILLIGEAGIGKTRLAEELLDWAERQGIAVLLATCYLSEKQLSYAPIAKWLRNESLHNIFPHLDRRTLIECSRLLPELLDQYPDLSHPVPLTESWQRQHFFSVLVQVLLKLRQPFLLFIDDLHWCDQDSLDWLLFLLHYSQQARFLLLGTARSEEIIPDHPLVLWQSQMDRDGRLTRVFLERLDVISSAKLAGQVLEKELSDQEAVYLFTETEGNPLFIVELARAGLSDRPPLSTTTELGPKVQAVIQTRLSYLSVGAYELAQVAATIGNSFDFKLLKHACAQDEESVIRNLNELWQRRIIRDRRLDDYDFSHDKIRLAAYESLGPIRSRQIHEQIWRALEKLSKNNLKPVSGQIAAHCAAAGHFNEALDYYLQAAKAARDIFANQDSLQYLQQAVDLFPCVDDKLEQQVEIFELLGIVLTTIGQYEDAEQAYDKAICLSNDPWVLSRLYQRLSNTYTLRRNYEHAHEALAEAEAILNQIPQSPPQTWWQEWLEIQLGHLGLYYYSNQIQEMAQQSVEVKPIVEKYASSIQTVSFHRNTEHLAFRMERGVLSDQALEYAQKAYNAAQNIDDYLFVASTRFDLAFSHLWHGWHGDLDQAETHFLAVLDAAEETGHVLLRTRCLLYLSILYRLRGNQSRVSELLPEVMAVAKEGNLQEYIAAATANLAWLKWRERDFEATKKHGRNALATWQSLPIVLPYQWTAIWPLIDVALSDNELADAIRYAKILLQPEMSRLPDELTAVLEEAIDAFTQNQSPKAHECLQAALEYAQQLNQL